MEIVSIEEFEEKVLQAKGCVLVDFYAVWCAPCRLLAPILEELEKESIVLSQRTDRHSPQFTVMKVDVDKLPQLAEKYGAMSVPTMIIFKNGREAERMMGVNTKKQIIKQMTKQMKADD